MYLTRRGYLMTFHLNSHLKLTVFNLRNPLAPPLPPSLTHTHTYCNNWSEATFDLPHLVANYLTNNYSLHFYLFHSYYIASIFP